MEIVHPVVLAAHIVVGAGQQQKLCIRPVKLFLHGAEAALKDGAFNMAKAVHFADKEHTVVQFSQRLDQKGIKLPAGQPVKFALELSPVSGLQHFQHRMFRHVIRLLGSESEYCFYFTPCAVKMQAAAGHSVRRRLIVLQNFTARRL